MLNLNDDSLWQQFVTNHQQARLPHAILLSKTENTTLIIEKITAAILCRHFSTEPCSSCQSCHLLASDEHPDNHMIIPEKIGSIIKIEQIRAIQDVITLPPQLGYNRVFLINPAEKLNGSAYNALLKTLEEPPANNYFILLANQLASIPATIISRCQLWRLNRSPQDFQLDDEYSDLINQINQLQNQTLTVYELAATWANHDFNHLINQLYLLTAAMIKEHLVNKTDLQTTAKRINLVTLYKQLAKLHEIMRNLSHNLSVNPLLTIEDWLLGLIPQE